MVQIRKATKLDIPSIANLIRELAEAGGETSRIDEAYVGAYLVSPSSRVLLAEDESGVVGLLSYSVKPDLYHAAPCCLVEELVVAADKRSRGIGGQLLESVIEQGRIEGWAEVSVSVMPGNQRAQAFYQRHGLVDQALLLERHLRG